MKRRRSFLLLALIVTAAVALWQWPRLAGPAGTGERPFTELEPALADLTSRGWEIHTRPPQPGPYRALPGGDSVAADANSEVVCMARGKDGAVEELRLKGNPDYQQTVVHLETPGGRQTMAVLRRPR